MVSINLKAFSLTRLQHSDRELTIWGSPERSWFSSSQGQLASQRQFGSVWAVWVFLSGAERTAMGSLIIIAHFFSFLFPLKQPRFTQSSVSFYFRTKERQQMECYVTQGVVKYLEYTSSRVVPQKWMGPIAKESEKRNCTQLCQRVYFSRTSSFILIVFHCHVLYY